MRLRPGVNPIDAARILRDQAGPVLLGGAVVNAGQQVVNQYVSWVSTTERVLRNLFVDPDLAALHTARYWHIRDHLRVEPSAARLHELVTDEGSWQGERLKAIASELDDLSSRLGAGAPTATLAVVDTNVFLHCHPLETFDWTFVAPGPVRVVVPIRVIEELDDKKRYHDSDLADRARKRIKWLRDNLVPGSPASAGLKSGATLEMFVPPGARELRMSADTEILESCEMLETFVRRPLRIVTLDLGMELRGLYYRAPQSGFSIAPVPADRRL